jgi:hypothetical protein
MANLLVLATPAHESPHCSLHFHWRRSFPLICAFLCLSPLLAGSCTLLNVRVDAHTHRIRLSQVEVSASGQDFHRRYPG